VHWIQLAQERSLRPVILNAKKEFLVPNKVPYMRAFGSELRAIDVNRPKHVVRIILYFSGKAIKS